MPKPKNSSQLRAKSHCSQKKSRLKDYQSSQNKQILKPLYYSVIQRIFTQQILQNKRTFVNNPKIRYFFGAIFHGLKKGVIKSSLSDFLLHADKIFLKSKISEIKEVIQQYIKLQENNKQKYSTNTIQIKQNPFRQPRNLFKVHQQYRKEPIKQKESFKENYQRKHQFLQQKQHNLNQLRRLSNFSTKISQYPDQNSRLILKDNIQSNIAKAQCFEQNNPQLKIEFSQVDRKYLTSRNVGKRYVIDNHFDDDKLAQLSNRLEHHLKLNKQYLQNSRTTRQQYR